MNVRHARTGEIVKIVHMIVQIADKDGKPLELADGDVLVITEDPSGGDGFSITVERLIAGTERAAEGQGCWHKALWREPDVNFRLLPTKEHPLAE